MICLMMMSSVNSQQRLSDSTVIVPVKSLRNALAIKADRDNLKNQLGVARDSITVMDSIITKQDGIIMVLDSTRLVLDSLIGDYEGTVTAKNGIIHEQDEKITSLTNSLRGACAAIVLTTISFVLILL